MTPLRIGVLRGGPSHEYEVSLRTGATILSHADPSRYVVRDILLTKDGAWYFDGRPSSLADIAGHVDLIWNALHGKYGEDGGLQRDLEAFGIPYTGSTMLPSAIAARKDLAKDRFRAAGLGVPSGIIVREDEDLDEAAFEIFRSSQLPLIVKPAAGGSSVATHLVRDFTHLVSALHDAARHGGVLVEEVVRGKEASVCVVEGSQGDLLVLPPVEIALSDDKDFFDFDAKYGGATQEIVPGRFPNDVAESLREHAARAHRALGLRHFSRTDAIVTEDGRIAVLETNTIPGMTEQSLFPKALAAGGVSLKDFIDHVIALAVRGKK